MSVFECHLLQFTSKFWNHNVPGLINSHLFWLDIEASIQTVVKINSSVPPLCCSPCYTPEAWEQSHWTKICSVKKIIYMEVMFPGNEVSAVEVVITPDPIKLIKPQLIKMEGWRGKKWVWWSLVVVPLKGSRWWGWRVGTPNKSNLLN